MAFYQYIGREYTRIALVEGGEKVKVVNGEIVESRIGEKMFTKNGFQKIEIEDVIQEKEIEDKKNKK